ncbi:MAG: hypothetical protein AAF547_03975 [Actinomycetota bacterium]
MVVVNAWESLHARERRVIAGAGVIAAVMVCGGIMLAVVSGRSSETSAGETSASADAGFDLETAAESETTTTTVVAPAAPEAVVVAVPEAATDVDQLPSTTVSSTTLPSTSEAQTTTDAPPTDAPTTTGPPTTEAPVTTAPATTVAPDPPPDQQTTTNTPAPTNPPTTPTTPAPTTTAAPTTTTTAAPTTTTAPANRPAQPTFHGVKPFNSFSKGTLQYDAWTSGDVAFYAPQGQVPVADGLRWVDWYRRVDELYRKLSTKDNFETYYRRDDPNFGRVKVLGIVETCGAGCGSKQQAEADPGYIQAMVGNPTDPGQHWIFYYEMGRTGSRGFFEDWYGKATWPTNTLIMPHMMAAVGFYELGGESLLRNGNTKFLFDELAQWEQANIEYVDQFPIPDQQSQNGYTSHHLMPAMLLTIMTETSMDTLERILENMSNEPEATNATQAMCDFQDAVNAATGGAYSARMKGPWGLPDNCP